MIRVLVIYAFVVSLTVTLSSLITCAYSQNLNNSVWVRYYWSPVLRSDNLEQFSFDIIQFNDDATCIYCRVLKDIRTRDIVVIKKTEKCGWLLRDNLLILEVEGVFSGRGMCVDKNGDFIYNRNNLRIYSIDSIKDKVITFVNRTYDCENKVEKAETYLHEYEDFKKIFFKDKDFPDFLDILEYRMF